MAKKSRASLKTDSSTRYLQQVGDPVAAWIVPSDHIASDEDAADSYEHLLEGFTAGTGSVKFDLYKGYAYGLSSALGSSIALDAANAIVGSKALIRYNSASAPTIGTGSDLLNPNDVADAHRVSADCYLLLYCAQVSPFRALAVPITRRIPILGSANVRGLALQYSILGQVISDYVALSVNMPIVPAPNGALTQKDAGSLLTARTTLAAKAATLPAVSSVSAGYFLYLQHESGANDFTVSCASGDTVIGLDETITAGVFVMNQPGKLYCLVKTDIANTWVVLWKYPSSAAVPAGSVTNEKLANIGSGRIKLRTSAGSGPPEDGTGAQAWGIIKADIIETGVAATNTLNFQKEERIYNTYTGSGKVILDTSGAIPGSVVTWYAQVASNPLNPIPENVYLLGDAFVANTLMRYVFRYVSTTQIECLVTALGALDADLRDMLYYWNMRGGYNGSNEIPNLGFGGAAFTLGERVGVSLPTYLSGSRELDFAGDQMATKGSANLIESGVNRLWLFAFKPDTLPSETILLQYGSVLIRIFASGLVSVVSGAASFTTTTLAITADTTLLAIAMTGTQAIVYLSDRNLSISSEPGSGDFSGSAVPVGAEIGLFMDGKVRAIALTSGSFDADEVQTYLEQLSQAVQYPL